MPSKRKDGVRVSRRSRNGFTLTFGSDKESQNFARNLMSAMAGEPVPDDLTADPLPREEDSEESQPSPPTTDADAAREAP